MSDALSRESQTFDRVTVDINTLDDLNRIPIEHQRVELVERKGIGHPDTIFQACSSRVADMATRETAQCCDDARNYDG